MGVEVAEARRRRSRQAFVDALLATLTVEVYDLEVARLHASLLAATRRSGRRPRGAHELLIAATALHTGRAVVTADPAGFHEPGGVRFRAPT